MVEHRNIANTIQGCNAVMRLSEHDRVLSTFSFGFDGQCRCRWSCFGSYESFALPCATSTGSLWGSLLVVCNGATLLVSNHAETVPEQPLVQFVNRFNVTVRLFSAFHPVCVCSQCAVLVALPWFFTAFSICTMQTLLCVPSMLAPLDPARLTGLRTLFFAGEVCPAKLAVTWMAFATETGAPTRRVINGCVVL